MTVSSQGPAIYVYWTLDPQWSDKLGVSEMVAITKTKSNSSHTSQVSNGIYFD
jgi:hypothetical protein